MLKWSEVILEGDGVEAMARLREQDDEFCRRLRAAVESGYEFCPIRGQQGAVHEPPDRELRAARLAAGRCR